MMRRDIASRNDSGTGPLLNWPVVLAELRSEVAVTCPVVAEAMQLAHLSVWLRASEGER
jgi:hypothetical protein